MGLFPRRRSGARRRLPRAGGAPGAGRRGDAASTSATLRASARSATARSRPTGARSGSSPAIAWRASSAIGSGRWKPRARPVDDDDRVRRRSVGRGSRGAAVRSRPAARTRRPRCARIRRPTADALMAALAAQQAAVRGMNARVRATSWLGGERVRATVNMLVERDGHLRFEAEVSLQGTVGDAGHRRHHVRALRRAQERIHHAAPPAPPTSRR